MARRAVVPRDTIVDFEIGSRTPLPDSLAAIRAALEAVGVIFIDENGEGPGVGSGRCESDEAALAPGFNPKIRFRHGRSAETIAARREVRPNSAAPRAPRSRTND